MLMAYVLNAINTDIEIYLDDGTGSPSGNALYTLKYYRAVGMSSEFETERLSHLGREDDEYDIGKESVRLTISKVVESDDNDMYLSNALYYVKVKVRNDDWTDWTSYNFKKCRRASWDMNSNELGAIPTTFSFVCESWDKTDLT
jgi:hypothetical protein